MNTTLLPTANPSSSTSEHPTRVRFLVVALCVGMALLLYLDRFAIMPVATSVLADLNLDKEQFGRAVGAFFLAYAFCQVPSGWLCDMFGSRWMLAIYVVAWSLATMGLGLAGDLLAIMVMRIVLGAAQAGAYPAAASLLKRWVPVTSRARANTIVSMGGRAGNLLAQFLTPVLAVAAMTALGWQHSGWRLALAAYGVLGLVWAVLFVWLYRDDPVGHPWVNDAERRLIGHTAVEVKRAPNPLGLAIGVVLSPEVWLISLMSIAVNIGWVFLVTWLPQFLIASHGSELARYAGSTEVLAGSLTAAVGLGGMLGGLSGGIAADRFVALYGTKWGRRLPGLLAGLVTSVLYLVAMQMKSLWPLVALMMAISFTIDFGLGAIWASYQDIGGRSVATVLGIGNMCGNLGAAAFGYYIGVLASADQWTSVFLIASCSMAIYGALWLPFDARRQIVW